MLKFQKTKNPTEEKPRPRRPKDMTKTQEGASRKEEPASHRQRAKLGKHYAINKMPLRVGQDRASATRSSRNLRGRAAELVQPGRRTPGERGKPRKGAELLRPGRRTPGEQRKPAEARPSFCGPAEGPRGSLRQGDEGFPNVQRRRRRSSLHCNSPTNFCLFLFSSMRLQTFKIVCRPLKNVCRPLKNVRRPFKNVRRRAFLNVDEFFESPKASRRKK